MRGGVHLLGRDMWLKILCTAYAIWMNATSEPELAPLPKRPYSPTVKLIEWRQDRFYKFYDVILYDSDGGKTVLGPLDYDYTWAPRSWIEFQEGKKLPDGPLDDVAHYVAANGACCKGDWGFHKEWFAWECTRRLDDAISDLTEK